MQNPFHRWLISKRIYCEHPGCHNKLTKATKVIQRHHKDIVVCAFHGYGPIETGLRERGRLEAK